MTNKIFFSYSWKDLPIAMRIYSDLIRNGLDIWRDEFSASPGKLYSAEINEAMLQCKGVIFLDSENSRCSQYVKDEWLVLLNSDDWKSGRKIIAICLINHKDIVHNKPYLFEGHNTFKYTDFSNCKQLFDNDRSYLNAIREVCNLFGIDYKDQFADIRGKDFEDELSKYSIKDIDRKILIKENKLIQLRIENAFPNTLQRLAAFAKECESMKTICPSPILQLGVEYLKSGDFVQARNVLNIYTKIYADDPRGWRVLASALYELEEFKQALDAYNKTIFLSLCIRANRQPPGKDAIRFNNQKMLDYIFVSRINRATTLFRLGLKNQAIAAYKRAIEDHNAKPHILPEHFSTIIDVFDIQEREQLDWIEKGLTFFKGDYDLMLSKARWMVHHGMQQKALLCYIWLARKDNPDITIYSELLPLLHKTGGRSLFLAVYAQCAFPEPHTCLDKYKYGFIQYLAGNHHNARKFFEESTSLHLPWYAEIWRSQ